MVLFSCFNGSNQSHKSKKTVRPSFEAYHKSLQDSSRGHSSEVKMSPSLLSLQGGSQISSGLEQVASTDRGSVSEDMKSMESNLASKKCQLKKSRSLGSGLYREGNVGDDTEQGFSCDGSNEQNGLQTRDGSDDREGSSPDNQKAPVFDSRQISCEDAINEYVSSNPDQPLSDKEMPDNSDTLRATPFGIVKSRSLSNLSPSSPNTESYARLGRRSRSFDDSTQEIEKHLVQSQVGYDEDNAAQSEKNDTYDSRHYSGFSKDWVVPGVENIELPNKNFKNKRIEEWVNDLQHCSSLEESDEPLDREDTMKGDSSHFGGLGGAKKEDMVSPGMLAAKRYISSLSAAATTAQLTNHRLAVIPFFSAFVSLRMINLSGNSIARITAGSLPRGLHTLNLSKNSISVIEGLRELTRLRVLDLSYNRILRIGHGLASCSALKELYLAGNKISEVEGLHRLLKLMVLDLRFNKISTAKCLGQLAANYSSLQAVSLEGNPAQKNVGDDHLRKHLQGLLPQLAYFNRQAIKMSTLKDSSERAIRLGTGSHQADRSLRPDRKGTRRGGRAAEPPKGRHGRLPPAGSKAGGASRLHHQVLEFGSRIRDLKQDFSMRRSRSEGTLGAL